MDPYENPTSLQALAEYGTLDIDLLQGTWTEQQYLKITNIVNHYIEYSDGVIERLPMPTTSHQVLLAEMLRAMYGQFKRLGGTMLPGPFQLRIREGKFRQPNVIGLLRDDNSDRNEAYWSKADLVVEIVSPENPEHDTVVKRTEYAEAGISEYWIVNPLDETITVLRLDNEQYAEHGVFRRGDSATSVLLSDLNVSVDDLFDADR